MPRILRIAAFGLALAVAPSAKAAQNETLSQLEGIKVDSSAEVVEVTLEGTKAPDFTSFTMRDPFRVVVDWAGSKLGPVSARAFERGLIRKITTQQFDSESEQISRVLIELAQETTYHVQADGRRVRIRLTPVAEPLPEPAVEKAPAPAPAPVAKAEPLPEGPLTEPAVEVPSGPLPADLAKVAPTPAAKTEPPAAVVAAKTAEPVKATPEPAPKAAEPTKPVKLASYPGVEKAPAPVTTPATAPNPGASVPTPRLASAVPEREKRSSANVWQPPSIPIKDAAKPVARGALPVVRLASAGEPVRPTATLPADADEPSPHVAGASSGAAGSDDFDPGPRLMKYIGFQQMADVSRVFVRLDGKAKWREVKADGQLILELVNTSIPVKNNERPLDTTYFNSAVTRVQAVKAGEHTHIEVKLREQVPYKITRTGTTIAIDFKRS